MSLNNTLTIILQIAQYDIKFPTGSLLIHHLLYHWPTVTKKTSNEIVFQVQRITVSITFSLLQFTVRWPAQPVYIWFKGWVQSEIVHNARTSLVVGDIVFTFPIATFRSIIQTNTYVYDLNPLLLLPTDILVFPCKNHTPRKYIYYSCDGNIISFDSMSISPRK